jgi:isopenicillin N synthase-like dioxygenase
LPYDYFSKFHNAKEDMLLRFTSYAPPSYPLVETDMGAGAHSDFGSITSLFQDDVGDLEVEINGKWIDATPIPDTRL